MNIGAGAWSFYINKLRRINDKASGAMSRWIDAHGLEVTDEMIETAYALSSKYGAASAALAAEMYDVTAAMSGAVVPAAVPAETATFHEVAKAIVGTGKTRNQEIMSNAVGRLVKMAGVDTTMQNAIRDGAEWAWIPQGETCAFCLTLASRGWQKASRKAMQGGHAEHIHANCDCTYSVRFDSRSSVTGYDPDKYLRMYEDAAPGKNSKEKINAMRREFYAENREKIRAQQADAYEKRKELESSAAEESP